MRIPPTSHSRSLPLQLAIPFPFDEKPVLFAQYIDLRDNAYAEYQQFCIDDSKDFDWDAFCLYAEPYCGGVGCFSLISPDAEPHIIRNKAAIWEYLYDALWREEDWIEDYLASLKAEEDK